MDLQPIALQAALPYSTTGRPLRADPPSRWDQNLDPPLDPWSRPRQPRQPSPDSPAQKPRQAAKAAQAAQSSSSSSTTTTRQAGRHAGRQAGKQAGSQAASSCCFLLLSAAAFCCFSATTTPGPAECAKRLNNIKHIKQKSRYFKIIQNCEDDNNKNKMIKKTDLKINTII